MKYSIEGIEKEKTIKSVELIKKGKDYVTVKASKNATTQNIKNQTNIIAVNYLDGTQDIFEFNEETLKRIENIMTSQAKEYVDNNSKSLLLNPAVRLTLAVVTMLPIAVAVGIGLPILPTTILGIIAVLCGTTAIVGTIKAADVKKYNLFLKKVSGKLNEYQEILKKENELVDKKTQKTSTLSGIRDLDKTSMKTLNNIVNKVDRYNGIEGKSPKTKTL